MRNQMMNAMLRVFERDREILQEWMDIRHRLSRCADPDCEICKEHRDLFERTKKYIDDLTRAIEHLKGEGNEQS